MDKKNNMVGIVVVCHNRKLARELINFSREMQHAEFGIENGGGTGTDSYGTNPEIIIEAVREADRGGGVLIFVDLGSAIMSTEIALEMLNGEIEARIADVPLIEGLISAVAGNFQGVTLDELEKTAMESRSYSKLAL